MQVDFQGEKYLFIYSHSADIGFTTCALVPMRVVTSQATEIRNMTIGLVILACVIVVIVGIFITAGIENNMRRISRKFGDVAKGDLTVTVSAKGHDEFQDLAGSATNMITNTKKLVNQVSNATGELEVSAQNVGQASELIHRILPVPSVRSTKVWKNSPDMHRSAWRRPISSPMRSRKSAMW